MEDDDLVTKNIELFIYEEGDLPTIKEEKYDSAPNRDVSSRAEPAVWNKGKTESCVEERRRIHRNTVETSSPITRHSSHVMNIPRTRSMPGNMKRSVSFMSTARYLQKYKITDYTHSDNLCNILSGLYAMFLVVLGASIPVANVFADDVSTQALEGFHLYLFSVSILFMIYVYIVVIHNVNPVRYFKRWKSKGKKQSKNLEHSISTAIETDILDSEESHSLRASSSAASFITETQSRKSLPATAHFSYNTKSGSKSLYLRLGAVAFGIGSVIHNGLEVVQFLEMSQSTECDFDFIVIIRPIFQLVFTFMQTYFVFVNSELRIHTYCNIARFGTMHLIATNLCVWLRVITIETVRDIQKFVSESIGELLGLGGSQDDHGLPHGISSPKYNLSTGAEALNHHDIHRRAAAASAKLHDGYTSTAVSMLSKDGAVSCHETTIMSHLLNSASPYLYPCAIEYCLIAAAIMLLIWNNIDKPRLPEHHLSISHTNGSSIDLNNLLFGKRNRVSVDCSGANRGLFCGIFILVLTIISIIIFFVFIDDTSHVYLAVTIEHLSLIVLHSLALIAVILAALRFRDMKFRPKRERQLEEALLVLSLIGVYMFRIFTSIAGQYTTDHDGGSLVLSANFIITLQATIQTIFIVNGLRRCARTPRQESHKPGREYVTFLLLCNISIWATNTFEVLRSDANPVSMNFYGAVPWSIITHVATPLTIFHQFHATVCLSTIWKTAYKLKTT